MPLFTPLGSFSEYQEVRNQDKTQDCDTFRKQVDPADTQTNPALLQNGAFAVSVASSVQQAGHLLCLKARGWPDSDVCSHFPLQNLSYASVTQSFFTAERC